MNEKKQKQKEKKEFAPFLEWDLICRVEGKQGLFVQITMPNKSNMIGVREFLTTNTTAANISKIERLSNVVIHTEDDKTISIKEAMYNIAEFAKKEKFKKIVFKEFSIPYLMDVICPNYSYKFKDYHAKKIINWYNILNDKINSMSDEK